MKKMFTLIAALSLCLILALPAAAVEKPGKGVTVQPARATWTTGFFQEALVRNALTELGYKVKKVRDLANPIFYQSVALGDIDYWCNGWFPLHNAQMPKNWEKTVAKVGYVAKAGGLQGYLISKKFADKFNIKSLDDFKRDEVKKAFDSNGDGKADLTACPPGWGCEKIIKFHLDTYKLRNDINPVKAAYAAGMASALGRFKNGEPIFFYTWAPNWTIHKLKPGKDVVWINVPEIIPAEVQKGHEDQMVVSDVAGGVTDPVKLGFVVNDIRVVANKKFLADNPAIKKFFELFEVPLADISAQNTRMNEGEKTAKDVQRHAAEWIKKNQAKWDGWLAAAREAAK